MIINHNISALNTQNSLNKNTKATQGSLQKLSSGLRINNAADDAAGLAISEKMKGQISGLEQASRNSQDGISMLQTAEGGLDQTHSILQRMRQLAVQSASDTNTADDRTKIQAEVDQLAKEITRISNTTEFNTQNLLAGGMSDTFHIGANAGQNINVSVSAMDAQSLGVAGLVATASSVSTGTTQLNVSGISRGLVTAAAATTGYQIVANYTAATVQAGKTVTSTVNQQPGNTSKLTLGQVTVTSATSGGYTGSADADYIVKVAAVNVLTSGSNEVTSISYSKDYGVSWTTLTGDFHAGVKLDGVTLTFATSSGATAASLYTAGDAYTYSLQASSYNLQLQDAVTGTKIGAAVDVHSGDTNATIGDTFANKTVSLQFDYTKIDAMNTTGAATLGTGLGTVQFTANQVASAAASVTQGKVLAQGIVVSGISVSTQADANKAITAIDEAIKTVSVARSQLGAYMNRMSNTIDNLNTSDENITAAQSRIADVDMSKEISSYQKNNVLQQAATAMLAHANQLPQTVLQLLQG